MGTSRTSRQRIAPTSDPTGSGSAGSDAQDLLGNQALQQQMLNGGEAPDRGAFEGSMAELREFLRETHTLDDYTPSTGTGAFDVEYRGLPGVLKLTSKVSFDWQDADPADHPGAAPQDLAWDRAAQEQFRDGFLREASDAWSGQHRFWCQRPMWESLSARTDIRFVEDKQDPHHQVEVMRLPPGTNRTSAVGPLASWGDGRIVDPWTGTAQGEVDPRFRPGRAQLDSNDLDPVEYPGGHRQVTAVHEAGHMLGLGDEYQDPDAPQKRTLHDELVQQELGHGVPLGDDGRIMSTGMEIGPEHGVTFLEALRKVTDLEAWGFQQRPLTPAPGPEQGDFPGPGPNRAS